jgi:hypothetical protein
LSYNFAYLESYVRDVAAGDEDIVYPWSWTRMETR